MIWKSFELIKIIKFGRNMVIYRTLGRVFEGKNKTDLLYYKFRTLKIGSGNSNCQEQNCWDECCNQYGKCPDDYDYFEDGSDYATCEYYYTDNTWVLGFIIPIVVVLIFTIIIVICIRKRRQQQQQWTGNQQVVIATQDNFGNQPTYGQQQPYGQQQYQPGYTEQPMYNQ